MILCRYILSFIIMGFFSYGLENYEIQHLKPLLIIDDENHDLSSNSMRQQLYGPSEKEISLIDNNPKIHELAKKTAPSLSNKISKHKAALMGIACVAFFLYFNNIQSGNKGLITKVGDLFFHFFR